MKPIPSQPLGYRGELMKGSGFFSQEEEKRLVEFAKTAKFEPGRQKTGYLKRKLSPDEFPEIQERSRTQLGIDESVPYDCYILKYPQGSHIPFHRDTIDAEHEHWRLNAILPSEFKGGELKIDYLPLTLGPGDFVTFRPDMVKHSVATIASGERLVWSFGCSKKVNIPSPGALFHGQSPQTSYFSEVWAGAKKLGTLRWDDYAIFTGKYAITKRTRSLRLQVLTRFGLGWIKSHGLVPV